MTVKTWDNSALRQSRKKAGEEGIAYGMDKKKELEGEIGGLVVFDPTTRKFFRLGEKDLYGPRGIEYHKGYIFVGTTEGVKIFNRKMKQQGEIVDKYGYWIHAVKCVEKENEESLVMGSSKLGTIMEYSFMTGRVENRWIGWENGFSESHAGALVTADVKEYVKKVVIGGKAVMFNKSDPASNLDKLTTPRQASRINGIFITAENWILATLFSGELIELEAIKERLTPKIITSGLSNPHTPLIIGGDYWVTNTHKGEVDCIGQDGCVKQSFEFSRSLTNKGETPVWLQSISEIEGLIVSVDSTRQQLIVMDRINRTKANVAFPNEKWAVQEITSFES